MKKVLLIAFVALATSLFAQDSTPPSTPPAAGPGIGGTYTVEGKNPNGARYEGSCVITGDAAAGFQFNWTIGADNYQGTGTLDGDTLTVDWGAPEPVVYKVTEDGAKLKGKWGPKGKGKEKLTKQ